MPIEFNESVAIKGNLSVNGTDVTGSIAELAALDGVTSTAAELNKLDGATVTVDEINELDGLPSSVDFTIGAADSGTCTVQLQDANGDNVAASFQVQFYLCSDETGETLASAPSGGVAFADSLLEITRTANVHFDIVTSATGAFTATLTEAGDNDFYAVVVLPNGKRAISTIIDFTGT